MRIWHKILIAPVLAIAFLLGYGAISYGVLSCDCHARLNIPVFASRTATR